MAHASAMLLQIYRDTVTPGREAAYKKLEKEAAGICARLEFPNRHLAMESLTGVKEVWWLNAFPSEAARRRIVAAYLAKPALVAALEDIARRKDGLTRKPVDLLTRYEPALSGGASWAPSGARFVVATVTRRRVRTRAAVFAAPDGTRYFLTPVPTRREADSVAAPLGRQARVFAVRPYWGMPAREWIAADPAFWRTNPSAQEG